MNEQIQGIQAIKRLRQLLSTLRNLLQQKKAGYIAKVEGTPSNLEYLESYLPVRSFRLSGELIVVAQLARRERGGTRTEKKRLRGHRVRLYCNRGATALQSARRGDYAARKSNAGRSAVAQGKSHEA
jgi:hypothetical protein